MNLKKFFLFMLIGIVCSVSVVSAVDINNTAVEIQTNDTIISVDGNDFNIQKFEDNTSDEAKDLVQSDNLNSVDENNLGFKIDDCRNEVCRSALSTGLHFNLNDNTAKDTNKAPSIAVAGIGDWFNAAIIGFKIFRNDFVVSWNRLMVDCRFVTPPEWKDPNSSKWKHNDTYREH